jgi:hypothetical protein
MTGVRDLKGSAEGVTRRNTVLARSGESWGLGR